MNIDDPYVLNLLGNAIPAVVSQLTALVTQRESKQNAEEIADILDKIRDQIESLAKETREHDQEAYDRSLDQHQKLASLQDGQDRILQNLAQMMQAILDDRIQTRIIQHGMGDPELPTAFISSQGAVMRTEKSPGGPRTTTMIDPITGTERIDRKSI